MDNSIEKRRNLEGAKDELARLQRELEDQEQRKEPTSYDELIERAKRVGMLLQSLQEQQQDEADIETLRAAETEATELLVRIDLAKQAQEIAVENQGDPDVANMPDVYKNPS